MHDADMFVLFDYEKFKGRSEEISDILEKSIKKVFKNLIRLFIAELALQNNVSDQA